MPQFATLLTDVPVDERGFRSVLLATARTALGGGIVQGGLSATHSYGDADTDQRVRDIRVFVRPANTAPRAALTELEKHGFKPVTALEFHCDHDRDSQEDAWALLGLYADELRGWVMTHYLDYDEAAARCGGGEGLLRAPIGSHKHPGVLIAASTLKLLTP
ncbi:MAG: hypothetical protein EYC70_08560 [Planctomycetota bacterium]|nr:MAG: hypothetical protein EYC70_08560 [Planctomycetota bacterium]